MDVFNAKWVSPHFFIKAIDKQLPVGIEILQVYQTDLSLPSLQSQVRYAEYKVETETEKNSPDVEGAIASLLSLEQLPWQHQRDTGTRHYDLRALIDDLWLANWHYPYCTIGMRLRCDSSGSGRPEQVAAAMGFTYRPQSIHRTKLVLGTG
jgi:radical SAM-linked protein